MKKLITFEANVKTGDKYDYRSIHCAVKGNATEALLSMLLLHEADINDARNMFGRSPSIRAGSFNSNLTCQCLLNNGAVIDCPDQKGNSPPFEAAIKNAHNNLELLLAWNARYLHVKSNDQTLLHSVAVVGNTRIFDILAAAKLQDLDANVQDNNDRCLRADLANSITQLQLLKPFSPV